MVQQASLLVTRVKRVDGLPRPAPPTRGRGRPLVSPDRRLLQALVRMMGRRGPKVPACWAGRAAPTPELPGRRALRTASQGRLPRRRSWARRLAARPATWPAQIGCLGRPLVALLPPWTPGQGPPRGLGATCRFALGAIFGYHLALLSRHDLGAARRVGLTAFIRAA
jgi:hypothetical protein